MKKITNILTALALVAANAVSCSDDTEPEGPRSTGKFEVDAPSEIIFAADGTSPHSTISVKSDMPWSVELDPADGHGWLDVASKTDDSFTLSAVENTAEEAPPAVTVLVTADGFEPVAITASQLGAGAPTGPTTLFNLEGVSGIKATVVFTDGSTADFSLDESGGGYVPVLDADAPRTLYSIRADAFGEVLLGRREGERIELKFEDGVLVFRDSDAAQIPVASFAELALIGEDLISLIGSYVQEADIDLLGSEALAETANAERQNWKPIGYDKDGFAGTYDGAGFVIENIWISRNDKNNGVFGAVGYGGTLISVVVVSGFVEGVGSTGAVCGENDGGTLKECTNGASVSGNGQETGGVCGMNFSGILKSCHNSGDISSRDNYFGGVCGYNLMGKLEGCRNTGTVTAVGTPYYAGGVCGVNNNASSVITDCHNEGIVRGYRYAGGITPLNQGLIENCSNVGEVSGDEYYVAGICGTNQVVGNDSDGRIVECLNEGDVNGTYYVGGITGYNYYAEVSGCTNSGTITAEGDYAGGICGAQDEDAAIDDCDNSGTVYGNALVAGICGYNSGNIAGSHNSAAITGITNIGGVSSYNTATATVQECSNGGDISGSGDLVAGVAAENAGALTRCSNTGNVTADGPESKYIAGVCGRSNGAIQLCTSTGIITSMGSGSQYVAGVCGHNTGLLENSGNKGDVTSGGNYVGGVCGSSTAAITGCMNKGDISSAKGSVGGIVGDFFAMSSKATACRNEGNISSGGNYAGGVVGFNYSEGVVACYSTGKVSGTGSSIGGINANARNEAGCYWLRHGSEEATGSGTPAGTAAFGSTSWPDATIMGWAIYDGDGTAPPAVESGKYWKSLGQWQSGGNPDGANSRFPKLWWEE